jgi:hypothetical protein
MNLKFDHPGKKLLLSDIKERISTQNIPSEKWEEFILEMFEKLDK